MAFQPSRRRFLAFAGLAFSGAAARPALAQLAPPAPKELIIDGKPVDPTRPFVQTVGSWRIVSSMKQSTAGLKEGVGIRQGGTESGGLPVGGRGAIEVTYQAGGGPDAGYAGTLVLSTVGNVVTSLPARVFIDDREVDSFRVEREEKRDLSAWFGKGLPDLAGAKLIRAVMTVGDTEYTVLEAPLEQTAEMLVAMKALPDFNARRAATRPSSPSGNSAPGQPCYITTACCDMVGLDDDCFELTALRRFRDTVMAGTGEGRRMIAAYYETAPAILAEMRRRGEERRLLRLYFSHILPSAVLARLGFVELPWRLYSGMTRRLVARYLPERLALVA